MAEKDITERSEVATALIDRVAARSSSRSMPAESAGAGPFVGGVSFGTMRCISAWTATCLFLSVPDRE
jgi:hypothetical protein